MVSIVIINYNDKKRIRRAINSALNQTYRDVEIIMVDDGSDNETREIYKTYEGKIKLVQLERDDENARTPSRARNAGIKVATGDYICFLDSDNYFHNDFVDKLIKLKADYAYCNWEIIGKQSYQVDIYKVWDKDKFILENYLNCNHIDHQCILFKRDYLDKIGHYDTRLPRSQDCDLITRMIIAGGEGKHCEDFLFYFEKHEDDQGKTIASIYGKTLWSLKNNINIQWLWGYINTSDKMLSFQRAVDTFINAEEWKEDYNNSNFKEFYNNHTSTLKLEQSEAV